MNQSITERLDQFTISELYSKLEMVAARPGKLDKMKIIKTFTEFELRLIGWALDPSVSFYIAKLPEVQQQGCLPFGLRELDLLYKLSSREVTGNAAVAAVTEALESLAPPDSEILRRIILKDLRAGVGATLINSVFPGAIPEFPYMRCSLPKDVHLDTWPWDDGVNAGLKMDGMFARCDVTQDYVKFTTRQGNTFPKGFLANLELAASDLFMPGTQTHGELTVWIDGHLQPRQTGNGLLNSVMQGGDIPTGYEVKFTIWDQIALSVAVPKGKSITTYQQRLHQLECVPHHPLIQVVENRWVHSYDAAVAYYKEVLARGQEGLILKHPRMVWEDKTSKHCVKLKLEFDVDLKIIGFNPGIPGKRTADTFGSLKCASDCEELIVDVAGFKRDMETYLHENRESVLGKIVTVRANAIVNPSESSSKYSLFHPRFIELRHDKDTADDLARVIAQFEAGVQA